MSHYFIVPGLGNSGPEHWQTYFEQSGPNFTRIQQKEWDAPACADWIANINKAIAGYDPKTVVLIGHSLGCTTIAHWAAQYPKKIKGAFLVAPSDVEAQGYDFPATGFAPIPSAPLGFPSLVIASTNDPWVSIDRAAYFAECWGSAFVNIGDAGHINAASGHHHWDAGLEMLQAL
ncbi:MAG TPA: alpha/beta fold hydrolase [Phnomibacter sp.]|nr:alpha/beta fold hydrolase [Phnomibacter sp.]